MVPNDNELPLDITDPNLHVGVGFSDAALLTTSLVGFCALMATIYMIMIARLKTSKEVEKEDAASAKDDPKRYAEYLARQTDVSGLNRAERRARARAIMKQQRRAAVPGAGGDDSGEDSDSNNDDGDDGEHDGTVATSSHIPPSLNRKERQKMAKATERAERRRNEDERKKQEQEALETARQVKKLREQEEIQRRDEERKLEKILREEREKEDQVKWATFLSSSKHTQTVDEWIDQLEQNRFVSIGKTATYFDVTSKDVVERIEQLMKEKRVAGIFDSDRTFIYFSETELQGLAHEIERRGSVSLTGFATMCQSRIAAA